MNSLKIRAMTKRALSMMSPEERSASAAREKIMSRALNAINIAEATARHDDINRRIERDTVARAKCERAGHRIVCSDTSYVCAVCEPGTADFLGV